MERVYMLTDKEELDKFLKDFPNAKSYIDSWIFNYNYNVLSKKEGAQKARFKKREKTLRKLATALCVLKEQNKKPTAYNLAKTAGSDWRTAKKFLDDYYYLIDEPIEKIKEELLRKNE